MSNAIENTRFIMCNALNQIRKAKKHPRLLDIFESAMEAHLEALRVERERDVMIAAELMEQRGVLRDAYECQQMRTHNALCESRRLSDDLWETRRELESVKSDREEGRDKLQGATVKLASQTQSIIALHRVVKDQQRAQEGLQERIASLITGKNRDQAEAHRQIMQAEAISDERWELIEEKQKLIVSQRKAIESLTFELADARKQAKKRWFWLFWMRKSTKAKLLPK